MLCSIVEVFIFTSEPYFEVWNEWKYDKRYRYVCFLAHIIIFQQQMTSSMIYVYVANYNVFVYWEKDSCYM